MKDFLNKLILYLACAYLIFMWQNHSFMIAFFVVPLIISSLCTYFERGKITSTLLILYVILSLFVPALGCCLPLLFYDSKRYSSFVCLIVVVVAGAKFLFSISPTQYVFYILLFVIAFLLAYYLEKNQQLQTQLYVTRDEGTEKELILRERNLALIENQDYAVQNATLAERNRIAREIHDNVGHLLTRSILQTGALQVINQDENLKEPLATLNESLNTAMTSIRTSVHDLHDDAVDLKQSLEKLITEEQTLSIRLDYDMSSNVPRNIKYAFISIVKEAINNVHKHSDATKLRIYLQEHPAFYQLQIEDNGTNQKPIKESGIGLTNMKERVDALKGTIRFTNKNGFGIFISIMKKA